MPLRRFFSPRGAAHGVSGRGSSAPHASERPRTLHATSLSPPDRTPLLSRSRARLLTAGRTRSWTPPGLSRLGGAPAHLPPTGEGVAPEARLRWHAHCAPHAPRGTRHHPGARMCARARARARARACHVLACMCMPRACLHVHARTARTKCMYMPMPMPASPHARQAVSRQ